MEIMVRANEPRVTELAEGQAVTVTHPWAKDQPFQAIVADTPPIPVERRSGRLAAPAVYIDLPAEHPDMSIGDRISVDVLASVQEDALILPNGVVREFAGRTFVVLKEGDRQRRVDVKTGIENEALIQIVAGLSEGEEVVAP